MRTRTENDVRKFNEALDRCRRPVFLVSADGTQYNMKSANDYYAGMGRWINDSRDEMEIFTSCFEDAGVMMDFCLKMRAYCVSVPTPQLENSTTSYNIVPILQNSEPIQKDGSLYCCTLFCPKPFYELPAFR